MAKLTTGRPLEAATAMALTVHTDSRSELLDVLLRLALEGDVRAAKLYLDYSLRESVKERTGLTLEDALQLIQKNASGNDGDSDAS